MEQVPASYIEFAERLVLPIHSDLDADQVCNLITSEFYATASVCL